VFPVLGYIGTEKALTENDGATKQRARAMLRSLQRVKSVAVENDEHAVRLFLCSDLCATWRLLGNSSTRFQCPYCTTRDLTKCGEPRIDFPGSLVDVPAPENGGVTGFVVPCMLHAWLRLANQRITAIGNRSARKDRGHTPKDAEELFHKLGLPFWAKTKSSDYFFLCNTGRSRPHCTPRSRCSACRFRRS